MPNIRGELNQIKAKLKANRPAEALAITDALLSRKQHGGGIVVEVKGKKYRVANEAEAKALKKKLGA